MQQFLHILLTTVILACPYVCCPVVAKADQPASCCHCAREAGDGHDEQSAPAAPSPCNAGDCLCRGAVLSAPVEMHLDLAMPCAICLTDVNAGLSAAQLHTDWSQQFSEGHSRSWDTGRELRLVIDSLLI